MPVMNVQELARRIRQRSDFDDVCLVAMTGYGQSSDREMAFKAGFDRHFTKPVDYPKLRYLFGELDIPKSESLVRSNLQTGGFH
jgi:CheY-like chemotaxis protein